MSIFGDIDWNEVPETFEPSDGTYEACLFSVKVGPTRKGDKVGATFLYQITDQEVEDGLFSGIFVPEWYEIPKSVRSREASRLKARCLSLGLETSKLQSPEDLKDVGGQMVALTLNKNGDYLNVTTVVLI